MEEVATQTEPSGHLAMTSTAIYELVFIVGVEAVEGHC